MIDEPIGGSALASAAAAAAEALAAVARASDDASLAQRAEVLRLRVAGTARLNAARYPRALAAREATSGLPQEQRDERIGEAYARAAGAPLALRPDAVVAGLLAAAAARGAAMLVADNLTAPRDDPRVAEAEQYAATAELAVDRLAAPP